MKKVLVTGAAGFIGAQVTRELLSSGTHVVGLDNFNDYYDPRLKFHRLQELQKTFEFEFIQMDLEDALAVRELCVRHKFDTVINLAARAGVPASLAHPRLYFNTNLFGTLNLLESMVIADIPKLVLASTSSVYYGEKVPFREDAAADRLISPYAASKRAAEQLAFTYHYHYGVDCTVVRYFTVYGPAGRPDMSVFRFMRAIDEGTPLEIYGDGEHSRDFTFVEDVAHGTVLAAELPGFEVINLGGGREPVTLNQMIQQMEMALGKRANIVHKPSLKTDLLATQADIAKAQRLLNWEPKVTFKDGLDRTLAWYAKEQELVRSLRAFAAA